MEAVESQVARARAALGGMVLSQQGLKPKDIGRAIGKAVADGIKSIF